MHYLVNVLDGGPSSGTESTGRASDAEAAAVDDFNERLRAAGQWVFAAGLSEPSQSTVVDDRGGAGLVHRGPAVDAAEPCGPHPGARGGLLDLGPAGRRHGPPAGARGFAGVQPAPRGPPGPLTTGRAPGRVPGTVAPGSARGAPPRDEGEHTWGTSSVRTRCAGTARHPGGPRPRPGAPLAARRRLLPRDPRATRGARRRPRPRRAGRHGGDRGLPPGTVPRHRDAPAPTGRHAGTLPAATRGRRRRSTSGVGRVAARRRPGRRERRRMPGRRRHPARVGRRCPSGRCGLRVRVLPRPAPAGR